MTWKTNRIWFHSNASTLNPNEKKKRRKHNLRWFPFPRVSLTLSQIWIFKFFISKINIEFELDYLLPCFLWVHVIVQKRSKRFILFKSKTFYLFHWEKKNISANRVKWSNQENKNRAFAQRKRAARWHNKVFSWSYFLTDDISSAAITQNSQKNVLITSPRVVWLRLVDVVASRRHRNFQKHKRNDDILFTYGLTVCLSSRWKIGNIFVPSHVFRFRSSLHDVNWSLLKYFCLTKTNIFTFIDHQNDQDDLNTWECHIGK